ncbi:hypothetical protein PHYPO_G00085730 [Pangasianodon hypophthalmus]|uniref:Uncharacterized protein n=1 Tax=Pangasianodon hypophthalmus TaxID=310915 RepID=A0A5N5LGX6_PANHP|nr:hypothetical protein PHYPO_G00085730 [Pangasianodon hypophthalmus]
MGAILTVAILGRKKKGKENPETEPLNPFKTKRRACAAGGSWLCVMCRCPECCKPRPRLLRHLSTQVCCSIADDFQLNFLSSGGQKHMRPKGSQSSDLG